ncbi:DUF554 domain-containing protein [uncultured Limosilactobacillus sp.]|uniref:DUF554 domain-containing protein n=1 Tax=uncultured Limosilactobacillus sp. TaxID=2837629 RepID=UPI0025CBC616|nr:DUF554 domain-containing protein [uncultured Limosilactobacillus sp.]
MLITLTGTFTDAGGVIIAALLGSFIGKHMNDRYKQILIGMLGFIALAVGFQSFASYMSKSKYAVLFIIAMILGTTLGTWWNLDGKVNKLASKGSAGLARSIVTECTLSCFGALPIVGSIMAATSHNFTFLFVNASLDFVMVMILSAADGIGMIVCAPIIFIYQFLLILIATFARTWLTTDLITEIAMLGGLMVASSGLSLMNIKNLKTTNQIPSLLIPIIFFTCKAIFHF